MKIVFSKLIYNIFVITILNNFILVYELNFSYIQILDKL